MILIQKTFLYKNLRKTSKKYKKQTFYNKTTKKFFYNIIIMIQKSCNVEPKTRALDSDSPSYAILQSNVEAMISNHFIKVNIKLKLNSSVQKKNNIFGSVK